jgi:hypothetical protein
VNVALDAFKIGFSITRPDATAVAFARVLSSLSKKNMTALMVALVLPDPMFATNATLSNPEVSTAKLFMLATPTVCGTIAGAPLMRLPKSNDAIFIVLL